MSNDEQPLENAFYSYMSFLSPSKSHVQCKIWLILSAYKELNVTQISSMTKEAKSTISKELIQMEEEGFLVSKIDKNYPKKRIPPRLFSINTDVPVGNPEDQALLYNPDSKEKILTLINRDQVILNLITSVSELLLDIYQEIKNLIDSGSKENFEKAFNIYQKYLWGEEGEKITWFRFDSFTKEMFDLIVEFELWLGRKLASLEEKITEDEILKFQELREKAIASQGNFKILKNMANFNFKTNNKNIFRFHREEIKLEDKRTKKNIYKKRSIQSDEILSNHPTLTTLDENGNVLSLLNIVEGEKTEKLLPMFMLGDSEIKTKIWMLLELYHELNVTQISRRLEGAKSTIARHLNTMDEMGILESYTNPNHPPKRIPSRFYRIRNRPNEPYKRITPFPHPPFMKNSLKKSIELIQQDILEGISAIQMFRHLIGLIEPIFQKINELYKENTTQSEHKAKQIFQDYLCSEGTYQPIIMFHTRTLELAHIKAHVIPFFNDKMLSEPYNEDLSQEIASNREKFRKALEFDRDRSNPRIYGSTNIWFPRTIFEYYKHET